VALLGAAAVLALAAVGEADARMAIGFGSSARAQVAASAGQTLRLRGRVGLLAADRGRVALAVLYGNKPSEWGDRYQTIAVWKPSRSSVIRFGSGTFGGKHPWGYLWPGAVALAGNTVAWSGAVEIGAHEKPMVVMRARVGRRSKPQVAAFGWSPDGGTGHLLGGLRSGGSRIAFNAYYSCDDTDPACPPGSQMFAVSNTDVLVMDIGPAGTCASVRADSGGYTIPASRALRCRKILQTNGPAPVLALGGGRIAIGRPDGSVALLDLSGTTRATIVSTHGPIRAVALDRADVVLLVRAAPGRAVLEVHDSNSGALQSTFKVTGTYAGMGGDSCDFWDISVASYGCDVPFPALRLDSAANGVVVYTLNQTLHLLRLADQRDVTVAHSFDATALHAQLDQSGLFFSYDVDNKQYPGRVDHLSWDALAQLLNKSQ
jgi:hypothetical protein